MCRLFRHFNIYLLLVVFLSVSCTSFADFWTIEDASRMSRTFDKLSANGIATDSAGNSHIVYGSNYALFHAWFDGTDWDHETVMEVNIDVGISIVIDSSDTIHIAVDTSDGLLYITGRDGAFDSQLVTDASGVSYPIIAIDSTGSAHITYIHAVTETTSNICYAANASGSWSTEVACYISNHVPQCHDMTLDSSDNVHISTYIDHEGSFNIAHVYHNGSTWQEEYIEICEGLHSSIAVDSLDNVFIAYCNFRQDLKVADNSTGTWRTDIVESGPYQDYAFYCPTIALQSDGTVHVSYAKGDYYYSDILGIYYVENWRLKHAAGSYEDWSVEIIDPNGASVSAMAIHDDTCHISSYGLRKLYCISGNTGSWDRQTVDYSAWPGKISYLKLDSNDKPHLAYYDDYYNEIHIADKLSGRWQSEVVPTTGTLTGSISMRMDMDHSDSVHITYQGVSYGFCHTGLGYVNNSSGSWADVFFDNYWSRYPAIAVDDSGNIHITHYRNPDDKITTLFDTTNKSGDWDSDVIDVITDEDQVCYDSSVWADLQCDDFGWFHAAYVFGGPKLPTQYRYDVKYARHTSGWQSPETVEADVGPYARPGIAIDPAGKAHIVYCNNRTMTIRYANNLSGTWQIDDVPTAGQLNSAVAIAVDSLQRPYVCYVADDILTLAVKDTGTWQSQIVCDDMGDYGGWPSIQLDSSGGVHISFYNSQTGLRRICYATNTVSMPVISVEPESFCKVLTVGNTASETIEIRNNGNADLNITSTTITGPDAGLFSKGPCASTIPAGGLAMMNVYFSSSQTGSFYATLNIFSNDPDNPAVQITLSGICIELPVGELSTKYDFYDFGEVIVDEISDPPSLVRVYNEGNTTLSIAGILFSDGINFDCTKFVFPFSLPPDDFVDINIYFTPETIGQHDCIMTVTAGPYPDASLDVAMTGVAIPVPVPDLVIDPDTFDFNVALPGGTQLQEFTIANAGNADLTIEEFTSTNTTQFTSDPNEGFYPLGLSLPVMLSPGEKRCFTVTFHPDGLGEFENQVSIKSDDPDAKYTLADYTGTAQRWNICDFDIDGDVDLEDFAVMSFEWDQKPSEYLADVAPQEPDGVVNLSDLLVFVENWMQTKQ